jgi:hypothetical protein
LSDIRGVMLAVIRGGLGQSGTSSGMSGSAASTVVTAAASLATPQFRSETLDPTCKPHAKSLWHQADRLPLQGPSLAKRHP